MLSRHQASDALLLKPGADGLARGGADKTMKTGEFTGKKYTVERGDGYSQFSIRTPRRPLRRPHCKPFVRPCRSRRPAGKAVRPAPTCGCARLGRCFFLRLCGASPLLVLDRAWRRLPDVFVMAAGSGPRWWNSPPEKPGRLPLRQRPEYSLSGASALPCASGLASGGAQRIECERKMLRRPSRDHMSDSVGLTERI